MNNYSGQDHILAILTSTEQMMAPERNGPLKNVIHGMIKHDLKLDNHYVG